MFSHLHVHTEYSKLDGIGKLIELILRAKELGQPALAITDHGCMDGLWKFQNLCEANEIKSILGEEFYFLNGYGEDGKPVRGHVVLLAKDNDGLQNLYKLQEIAYKDNFYAKPMITMPDLMKYHNGLICTSACLANAIPQAILNGKYIEARTIAKKFKELFGDDFYLEIQPNTIAEQFIVNKELVKMSHDLKIQLVATNDVHYVLKDDSYVHEVSLALSTNKKMSDPKRWKFSTNDFWLKSEEEMRGGFRGLDKADIDGAIYNTNLIVSKCNAKITRGHFLPKFPFEGNFEKEVWDGYEAKKDSSIDTGEYRTAIQEEIECIKRNGYADYFLIVQDYIRRARANGIIVGDGRGSGAGSKCCYAMDITRVEPEQYNLLFERFLADGREPDIDTDFSDIDAVFELLGEAYGWENVARIISFGTLAPRAVTRKILSIFEHPIHEINTICKLIPELPGLKWKDVLANQEYIHAISKFEKEWKCIQRLQGNVSHTSMHAGGVVIWEGISNILPVKCIPNMKDKRIKRVACFDMDDLHDVGVFKFDILGLSTLEVVDNCLENIKEIHGIDLDLSKIDYEDKNVINMIASGDVQGIFQLEEQAERVMQQGAKNFRDIIAINALIRPGTGAFYFDKRSGKQEWSVHPLQEKYMSETYGEYVYQEQFMMDAHVFAGWSIAQADKKLRKNKDIYNDKVTHDLFMSDCLKVGLLNAEQIEDLWNKICEAVDGGYSFNKSHSATYARIAFQQGHLKYYFPECFYSALLTKHGDNQEKVGEIIAECKSKKIKILPPSINESGNTFTPCKDGIRYRLNTIDGVGDTSLAEIIRLRPIRSLHDLLERRTKAKLKNNNIEALIKAGAFDFVQPNREQVMCEFLLSCRTSKQVKDGYIPSISYNKAIWEFDSLGMFLTEHILDKYAFKPLSSFSEGTMVMVAGIVNSRRVFNDKKGNEMAFITISNQYETIKLIFFASKWDKSCDLATQEGNVIYVKGVRQGKDCIVGSVKLIESI